jgi:hypothetical protein
MITNITTKIEKGRIYATITRNAIVEGERISIAVGSKEYYKYLPNAGDVVQIDLTPYCEGGLRDMGDALNALPANGLAYGVEQGIAVIPDIDREQGFTLYYKNAISHNKALLTKLPYLQMSEGGDLLLALLAADDYNDRIICGDVQLDIIGRNHEDLCIVRIRPTNAHTLTLTDTLGYGGATLPIRTVPSGMNTRRLVWINEVGGIDSWSFEFLRESSFATSSEVFYSTKGYTRIGRISERAHTVETRELDDITASVVAYVIASPEVYLEENGKLVPIDIVTEECRTYSDTELTSIQIVYRPKVRETL